MTPEPAPNFRPFPLPRGAAFASAALILLFAAQAVTFAFHEGVWYDEACSMTSAQGTLGDSLEHADRMEQQPPLYFLILNLWLRLHRSIGFARLLSLVPTIFGVLLTVRTFMRLSRPQSPAAHPLLLAVLLASPMTMYLATEARGYAFQFALGALLASTMAEVHSRGSATRGDVVMILGAGVLLSYINYLAGMAAACATIALLVSRTLSARQAALIAAGGILLGSPLLLTVRNHVQSHAAAGEAWTLVGPRTALARLTWVLLPHAVARGSWQAMIGAATAVAVAVRLILRRRAGSRPVLPRPFLLASGMTVGILVALGFATGAVLVGYERYYAAYLSILLVTSLSLLHASLGWKAAMLFLLTLAAGGEYRILVLHGPGIRQGDWRRIAAKLDQDPAPSLPVYVFPPPESLTLKVEIADPGRVEAFPRDYDGNHVARAPEYRIDDPEAVRARIARRAGSGRFWLAYTLDPIAPVEIEKPLEAVESFIDRRCVIEGDFPFKDCRLLLLHLRP